SHRSKSEIRNITCETLVNTTTIGGIQTKPRWFRSGQGGGAVTSAGRRTTQGRIYILKKVVRVRELEDGGG
ncbi:hypothetical protein A2U01_0077667, partial [Trifolium medium]|nr:hypothetical protein [Trifolium medium]